jgi:hypothetical protein
MKNWVTFNGNHSFSNPDTTRGTAPETTPDVVIKNGDDDETIIVVTFPDKEIVNKEGEL